MKYSIRYSIVLLISALTFSLTSCSEEGPTKPCDYTAEKFKMIIVDIKQNPEIEDQFIVEVDFDGNIEWAGDLHTLDEVRDNVTTKDYVDRNYIEIGNVYSGTYYKKVPGSGDCMDHRFDWDQNLSR